MSAILRYTAFFFWCVSFSAVLSEPKFEASAVAFSLHHLGPGGILHLTLLLLMHLFKDFERKFLKAWNHCLCYLHSKCSFKQLKSGQMTISLVVVVALVKETELHINIATKMEPLCEQLDSVLLEYFDTLEQFYQCQATLEQTMKSGNLHMSRARYIRGAVSISQCQITDREMQASVRVDVSDETTTSTSEEKDRTEPTFTLVSPDPEDTKDTKQSSSDALRRRRVDTESEYTTQDEAEEQDQNKPGCGMLSKDPLHWFGVLVPQALRYSQKNYKSAVEQCVELANLQSQIQQIQTKYEDLLNKKNVLAMNELNIS